VEVHGAHWDVFSFAENGRVMQAVREYGWDIDSLEEIPMNLEDAFIGYTGRY
jgi:ABC-2 type transport system ATP-binding protein